jgi:hypothetical protein
VTYSTTRYRCSQAEADAASAYSRALHKVKGQLASREGAASDRERAVSAREQAVKQQEGQIQNNSFGNGLYKVGTDIQPGEYHAPGGGNCYWAYLGSADEFDIISNHFGSGPQTISISSPFFTSDGCGTWVPV